MADFKGTYYPSQNTVAATLSFRTGNRPPIKMDGRYIAAKQGFEIWIADNERRNDERVGILLLRLDTQEIVGAYEHQNGTITIERRGEQFQVTGTYNGKSLSGSYFLRTNHLTGRRLDLGDEDDVDGYNSPEADALYLRIFRSGAPEQVVYKRQKSTTSTPSSFEYVGNAQHSIRERLSRRLSNRHHSARCLRGRKIQALQHARTRGQKQGAAGP